MSPAIPPAHPRVVMIHRFVRTITTLFLVVAGLWSAPTAQAFTHPGFALNQADLDEVKSKLSVQPWKTGYDDLVADSKSQLSYNMQGPFASVSRTPHINLNEFKNDMQAVYNLSLMWYFTNNSAYAQKARDILITWATGHTSFDGGEMYLSMGDYAYRTFGGAEILRGTWPGWTQADTDTCKAWFGNVWWGGVGINANYPLRSANQGILQLVSQLGVAIFNDDQAKFDICLHSYRNDVNGGLPNTLPNGVLGDSGRDQHSYGQLQHLTQMAAAFWNQGVDVWSDLDNRLLAAGEMTGRYNLSLNPNWVPYGTKYDYYWEYFGMLGGAPSSTLSLDAINLIHNAYVVRKGMIAPWMELYRNTRTEDSASFVYRRTSDRSIATPPAPVIQPAAATAATTGFTNTDISASPAGSGTYSNGTWTVKGAGTNISGSSDSFHYLHKQVSGDFTFVAKLTSLTGGSSTGARASIEMRNALSANASKRIHFGYIHQLTNGSEVGPGIDSHQRGYTANSHNSDGEYTHIATPELMMPHWMKIQRIGSRISVFHSADGGSWTPLQHSEYDGWTGNAYVGLGVCSRINGTNGQLATATFTDVSITGGDGNEAAKPPAAPPSFVYASSGNHQVHLRWLEAAYATSYNVKRSTTPGGPYTTIANVSGTSHVDFSVTPSTDYYYVVSAVNAVAESGNCPEEPASVKPSGSGITQVPSGNVQISAISSTWNELTWTSSSPSDGFYRIERSASPGGPYSVIATDIRSLYYQDTKAPSGSPSYYKVSYVPAAAKTVVWNGGANTAFANGTNWEGGLPPANDLSSQIGVFSGAATPNQPVVTIANRSVSGLDFQSGGWTLSGSNTLGLGVDGISSTGNVTVSVPLNLSGGGSAPFSSATGGTLSLDRMSNGNLTIGKSGKTGTVVLGGNSDNSDLSPTLEYGTLVLSKASSPTVHAANDVVLDAASGGTIRLAGSGGDQILGDVTVEGGTLDLNGTSETVVNLTGSATAGIVTNTASSTVSTLTVTDISGTYNGKLNNGAGVLALVTNSTSNAQIQLGNTSSYSGGTVINGNKVRIQTDTSAGTGSVTFTGNDPNSKSTLFIPSSGYSSTTGSMKNNLVVGAGNVGMIRWGRSITVPGTLTGAGTLYITHENRNGQGTTVTGNWSAFAGQIIYRPGDSSSATTNTTNLTLSNSSGLPSAILTLQTDLIASPHVAGANGDLRYGGTANATIPIGDLNTDGNADVAPLRVYNNTTGTTTFQVGALGLSSSLDAQIIDGSATAKTAITKVGGGTWTLVDPNNSYSGQTSVEGGTLSVAHDLADTAVVRVASGAVLNLTVANDVVDSLWLDGAKMANPGTYGPLGSTATYKSAHFTGSGTLSVTNGKALATVTLGNLTTTYNGSPKAATATTNPPGLAVSLTYDGSPTAPTAAGSYAVVASIVDYNYQGTASGTLVINKATATVTLSNLAATYNGVPKAATATTNPAGLTVGLTYNGSSTAPTAANSYAVVATVNDTNYQGSASGTLVIGKATATVTLGNLAATYDGSPKAATATTTPAGLTVNLTYNGSSTAPTLVKFYAVVATVSDTNYQGSASGTLVISKATATVTLGNLAATYDGSPKAATATTTPAGLTVNLTYNGSSTAPTAASSYAVVATINDSNYQGSASDTLIIGKATATVTLGKLAATYDGSPKTATATTDPAGLNVDLTYDGSVTAPSAASSYTVVATINDTNYQGSASDTLIIGKATATVTLGNLAATYDGNPKAVTATTTPAGLSVDLTYDGSATAPTNANSYAVVATINDSNYQGTASDSLIIGKAVATMTLGNLVVPYDGSPKAATATTDPAGLNVDLTYDGSPTAPSAAGSYAVVGTIDDVNYEGTASGTLSIGYAGWAVDHAGSQTADQDFDLDGVDNGIEYFMNAAAGFTANPGLVGGTVTWPNGGIVDQEDYGVRFVVQTSADMVLWSDVPEEDPQLSNTEGSVSYTPNQVAPFFVRLVVAPD